MSLRMFQRMNQQTKNGKDYFFTCLICILYTIKLCINIAFIWAIVYYIIGLINIGYSNDRVIDIGVKEQEKFMTSNNCMCIIENDISICMDELNTLRISCVKNGYRYDIRKFFKDSKPNVNDKVLFNHMIFNYKKSMSSMVINEICN